MERCDVYRENTFKTLWRIKKKNYGNLLVTDLLLEGKSARINLKSVSVVIWKFFTEVLINCKN